jgi:hypothetical protein
MKEIKYIIWYCVCENLCYFILFQILIPIRIRLGKKFQIRPHPDPEHCN